MHRLSLDYLESYDAGEFPEDISARYGVPREEIVNLNSNENPYPLPKSVLRAIEEEARLASRYPNPSYAELKRRLGDYTGLGAENIAVASGAGELLSLICTLFLEPLDRVVIPLPTYTMYAFLAMLRDASIAYVEPPGEELYPPVEEIAGASRDAKLVFLCSPNNPTGRALEEDEVLEVVEGTRAAVVVDEAYYEFRGRSVAGGVEEYENLIVVRSFSKFFGLAGLRVGYALANARIASLLEKIRNPFCISRIAERAAVAALGELEYYTGVREKILRERERLLGELRRIPGLRPYPSEANFLLVKLLGITAGELMEGLYRRGIIVRNVSGLPGLRGDHVRITVGTPEENSRLISALEELLG
ncbi:MAG: histidinol-phosphate transaminase [Euryarchaeota archaeon]|nr:histidinol-phosphate transaminase [Euryarchaeota archaeon]